MASGKTDLKMVEGYLAGDKSANDYVEACIEGAFLSWRHRFGYQTDDILSDSRYKLYISLKQGEFAQKSSLKTYISGIVRHTCLDYYRAQKRFERVDIDDNPLIDPALSAEDKLKQRETAFLNFRVLRLVSRDCLNLWRMQLKEGLRSRAIGERLGKSEVSVRGQLMKCRQKARDIRKNLLKTGKTGKQI
jgi:RNA polymerase sigma factor (sigma-70 family)